ncbi:ARC6/PARC6 family protein [Dolichospermum planctonicum UHCC 0167]|uniref:ARC6/PARC6 family protein n=1 Tax=Dolichospermum planctonicum TaxID=136072 RepID=UPI0020C4E1B9|nr:ARC6/PARC6 family protein [Dolichospermum planctonicum]MCW9683248.1 ARC6/PARC6 family protein [Dolichospermum planctonicum UHCC 0167]
MLKNLVVYSTCLSVIGCQTIENPLTNVSSNAISSSGCGEKPMVSLSGKDVEEVVLNESTVTKSGQVSANKNVGYTFTAKTGQKLSYNTDADVCLWVFTPDNAIFKGGELPRNGKYIIQVAAPQGVKTFDLTMGLGVLETAASIPTVSPTDTPEATSENTSDNNNYQSSSEKNNIQPDNIQPENDISQEQALELVEKWYAAKPRIFAPPFDKDLLNELATGKLYQRVGGEDGSIDWLQKYNRYYTYNKSAITNIMGFSNSGSRPYIKVRVVEELYLQGEKGIDQTNSGEYQIDYIYFFAKDNGTWKIYNNEKISDAG